MAPTSRGIPVISSRQWTTGLSPNAAGDGWNYIAMSYNLHDPRPAEWVVLKDLTGVPYAPSQAIYETLTGIYASTLYKQTNQLRAANGRIIFPMYHLYTCYYDPDDEQVHQIGPVVETPPIGAHTSTTFYQASFDTAGQLYFSTQESEYRPSCIVHTDPDTLAQTVLGYVGDGALAYTTYGYRIAPDTGTAQRYVYVSYGENPWQLWALNIDTGVATKLYEVGSTGFISFTDIAGKGWRTTIDTNVGQPDNVRVQKWCIDGALYDYVPGVDPPNPRNVTPYSNPLVGAPSLDTSGGIGVVGWRDGASGPYTYVNYSVNYALPIAIESLVNIDQGILGNAQQYQGFFEYDQDAGDHTWFGPWAGGLSGGPRLTVGGTSYLAGYPNGVLYEIDASSDWQANTNPLLLGNYAPQGTQLAGIKYADYLAWSSAAGGRLYCAGSRERNGTGAGIGLWTRATGVFAGTFAGLDTVLPTGLVALDALSRVVMASRLITPPGTASLYIFDQELNQLSADVVIDGLDDLGRIFPTSDGSIICGVVQGSGNSLGLYQYNVATHTLASYVEIAVFGDLGSMCIHPGGAVWLMVGDSLVRVDVNALTATVEEDLSSIAPVVGMSFGGDGHTLYLAGAVNDGVSGAEVFTVDVGASLSAASGIGHGVGMDATLLSDGNIIMVAGDGTGVGIGNPVEFSRSSDSASGDDSVELKNNESTAIMRCQPVYSDGNGAVRLACANGTGTSRVIGLVADTVIQSLDPGSIRIASTIEADPDEWDAVCGTSGGLVFDVVYYLDPITPGRLTSVAPTLAGHEVVPAIRAISPTQAVIAIEPPVLL